MEPTSIPPGGEKKPGAWIRLVVIAVVVVIAAGVALGIGIPALQRAAMQPKMTLTDVNLSNNLGSCHGFFFPGPPQYFGYEFTLRNTGDADGFATVAFLIDGKAWSSNRYFVLAYASIERTLSVAVNDCDGHTSDMRITATEKA